MNYQILINHPTMAPFCRDEEKYQVVKDLVKQVEEIKNSKTKIDNQEITRSINSKWCKIFI